MNELKRQNEKSSWKSPEHQNTLKYQSWTISTGRKANDDNKFQANKADSNVNMGDWSEGEKDGERKVREENW